MLTMEQIEAAMYQKMKISGKQMENIQGVERDLTMEGGQREHIIRWFVDTQAALLLYDGSFPPWFKGFISRQEAEDHLRDMIIGGFLIRLSEKGIGYILSYKGQDRCRHFVINPTKTGQVIVSGDSTTHNSLAELIDHFTTTPIQPFGEYLTSYYTEAESMEKDPKNDIYDEFQIKPTITLGVSVRALRSLWEQTSGVHHETSPDPPSKSNRKLTTSTSIDGDSLSQAIRIPTLPKKNPLLRNSLSADFAGSHPCHDQQSFSEPTTSGKTGVEQRFGSGRRDSRDPVDCDFQLKRPENSNIPSIQINCLLPFHDENIEEPQAPRFNPAPSSHAQPFTVSPSSSYASLGFTKAHTGDDQLPHTGQIALQPNPLYQELHAEKEVQPESEYDNPTTTKDKTLSAENTYQVIPDQCENDTYEHIPEIHRSNTCDDVPASDSNTYASLEEMQANTEKKNHKWWKLRPESKKK
nr:hematopoietic SH2 domain-containing protein [Misgurnus anguillicaudatus]